MWLNETDGALLSGPGPNLQWDRNGSTAVCPILADIIIIIIITIPNIKCKVQKAHKG